MDITELEKNNLRQLRVLKSFKWYVPIKTLDRGDCFGEAAFTESRYKTRKESMKAAEATGLAVLKKEDYLRVLQKVQKQQDINWVSFLKTLPLFNHVRVSDIEKIVAHSTEEQYSINNFVFKQDTSATHFYVVYSGEFEVLRQQSQKSKLMDPVPARFSGVKDMKTEQIKKYLKSPTN